MSSAKYRRPLALTLWYSTLFVVGSIVIVLLTYVLTAASLAQRDQQIIQAKLGEYAAVYTRGGVRALAATVQAEQRTAPERLFVRVVNSGSEAIVLSDREQWDPAKLETASLQLLDGTLVQVGKSTEAREDILSRFRAVLGVVTLSIVVIALTGGWLATQSALRPIRQLATAVRRVISTGQIDQRVPVGPHDDEIDELTRLFNEMLEKIEGLVTGMHGALDNVSHDLRTPLTRLRGTAEMALAGQAGAEGYREALADCVEETDRVLVMLNTLMDISEAESGAMPLHREAVRLADIAARAVDLYRDVAEAKGVTIEVKTADDAVVSADRVRLEQVAANLLDNAVKYTPAGGHVTVAVLSDGGRRGVLRVRDSGIGIPADELPHIFERLYRGDVSRTERGLGLGLSLVKAVVEAHGGIVTVESKPGQGSSFTVVLNSASPTLTPNS
jgi:signal transduction histidine kinase